MVRDAGRRKSDVRIVIADDHLLFAESLQVALTLEAYSVRRVPLGASDGSISATAAAMLRTHPDIAIVDLDLGRTGDGVELIGPLRGAGVAVIVMTASTERARWGQCVEAGATAILTKDRPLDDILATVRRVSVDAPVMTRAERAELVQLWRERSQEFQSYQRRLDRLTARERDVLGHLTLGRTVSEIATLGTVSPATVRTQVKSILAKLEVSSQIAAVGIAHHVGWRSPVS